MIMPSKTIASLFVFRSDSDATKTYQTLVYQDGTMSCECPGWKFKKKLTPDGQRTCKHLRWIDTGLAEAHAVTVKQYAPVWKQSSPLTQRPEPQQPSLPQRQGRRFELEEV